jgi:hypothetical protein
MSFLLLIRSAVLAPLLDIAAVRPPDQHGRSKRPSIPHPQSKRQSSRATGAQRRAEPVPVWQGPGTRRPDGRRNFWFAAEPFTSGLPAILALVMPNHQRHSLPAELQSLISGAYHRAQLFEGEGSRPAGSGRQPPRVFLATCQANSACL